MILADAVGTLANWGTVGAAVFAGLALIVAVLARLDARRSARASERSADAAERSTAVAEDAAQAAARSAAADEAALAIARRDAEHQDAERHDRAGPGFVPLVAELREGAGGWNIWLAVVELRVDGGPDEMQVRVELVADTSFQALLATEQEQAGRESLDFDIAPGGTIHLCAVPHWDALAPDATTRMPLLLQITTTTRDEPPRQWVRRPRIDLRLMPRPRSW